MNLPSVLLWGFIATLVLTALMSAGQALGLSRMSVPYLLGTLVTPRRDRAMTVGFLVHLINGWLFSLLYALIFESWHRASWLLGALVGLAHGLIVLISLLPLLPGLHPRMASETHGPSATRSLQPPGFMGLHYGRRTPLITLVAHVAYGSVLGAFYHLAGRS